MDGVILLANLLALGLGATAVVLAHRLDRKYRLPYLRDYLIFVVLVVVTGFFDWIVFNLISTLVPGLSLAQADAIYHVFWDLIGFPCAVASAVWLLFSLAGLLQISIRRRLRAALATPALLLGLLSVVRWLLRLRHVETPLDRLLWLTFSTALPLAYLAMLVAALVLAMRQRDRSRRFLGQFILLLLLGLVVWLALSLFPSPVHPSYRLSILWFDLALLPPTILLRRHLCRTERVEVLAAISPDSLAPFFEHFELTAREKEVVALLAQGKSYRIIATELFVSLQTVKNNASRIYHKLEVANRVELVNLIQNTLRARRDGG